jgi:hypothetical protein
MFLLLTSLQRLVAKGPVAIMCKILIGMIDRECGKALEIYVSCSRGVKENREEGTRLPAAIDSFLLVA